MKRSIWIIVLTFSMAGIYAWAESDDDYTRIARISYMEGYVSFQGSTDVDWTAASINFPLQPGDRIYTGTGGRAEIEFDEGSIIRLAESTDVQFLSLRENLIQIRVLTGLSTLVVSNSVEFEVDTPAAAFIILRPGSYRFDTEDNGDTYATVRKGELEVVSHRFVQRIQPGMQIIVTAGENSTYDLTSARGRDAWDEWNDRRSADRIARNSRKYIPDNVYVGVSELDRHGRWVTVESHGVAWIPSSVSVSWSPYSVGRWSYRPGWGWTWVSYETWGWLPYHYGRWHHNVQYGWYWLPGPSFSFNFWSPGLVTFYYGPSWVSWGPLGPGDYYSINNYYYNKRLYSHYAVNLRKLHLRSPGNNFNRHVRGAFRTMELDDFRNGRSGGIATSRGYKKIDKPWERGSVVRERLAVRPTARSFSPNPDRRAESPRIAKPRPAVVYSRPSVKAKRNDAYVSVKNMKVSSRVAGRSSATDAVSDKTNRVLSASPSRVSGSSQNNGRNTMLKRSERANNEVQKEPRSYSSNSNSNFNASRNRIGESRNSQVPETKRLEPARDSSNSVRNSPGSNELRNRPQNSSRQYIDSSASQRLSTERNPIGNNTTNSSSSRSVVSPNNRSSSSSRSNTSSPSIRSNSSPRSNTSSPSIRSITRSTTASSGRATNKSSSAVSSRKNSSSGGSRNSSTRAVKRNK